MNSAQKALHYFEKMTGLPIVIHDLRNSFWHEFDIDQYRHSQPICRHARHGKEEWRCLQFELNDIRSTAHNWHNGRIHQCHAGLVEIAQPVFDDEGLLFILFAGPFKPKLHVRLDLISEPSSAFIKRPKGIPLLDAENVEFYQEALRQLGSRLYCLTQERKKANDTTNRVHESRRKSIENFLLKNLHNPIQLKDLAQALSLSADRCRHVIKENFDIGFAKLVRQMRMRFACSLLLNTELTIEQVATRCGLNDPSGFSREFKRTYGLSPGQWRKKNRA